MMETPGRGGSRIQHKRRVQCSEKQKEKVNTFFSKLEVGDLCFTDVMEKGVALLGDTKAGKTTLAHYLIQNPLVGNHELAYEMSGATRFKEAIIGHQPVSQTEIPNKVIKCLEGAQELHILDCPGYSDSKGCFMVIANGYFHYRVFSRVKSLKFVIAFDYGHMSGVFDKFKNTLVEFLISFKDFHVIGEQIVAATSFVFTKVPRHGQSDEAILANIKAKLEAFSNCGSVNNTLEHRDAIRLLVSQVIAKNRYFFFQKAEEGRPAPRNNQLLQEIHARTSFWQRGFGPDGKQVDMSHIEMTLGQRVRALATRNDRFRDDFAILTSQFRSRIEQAILTRYNKQSFNPECSLQRITTEFMMNSILGSEQQRSFFTDYLTHFVSAFNIYTKEEFNRKPEYQQKRAAIKKAIVTACPPIDQAQVECLQKLEICRLIISMVQDSKYLLGDSIDRKKRNVEAFRVLSQEVLKILVQFRKIRFFRDSPKEKREYEQKLDEFNYILFRLFEEARAFKIIFASALEGEGSNEFAVQNLDSTQVFYDYIQSISDEDYGFISMSDSKAFQKCKLTFLTHNLRFAANEADSYYTEIENYFTDIRQETAASEKLVTLGMVKLSSNKSKADKKARVTTFLAALRSHLTAMINADQADHDYILKGELYIQSANKLAGQLIRIDAKDNGEEAKKALRWAIRLFDTTNNVHQALEAYRCLLSKCHTKELLEVLVEAGNFAAARGRAQLALQHYQHAYGVVQEAFDSSKDGYHLLRRQEREIIANKIGMLGVERKHSPSQGYLDALLKKKLFTLIDSPLLSQIEAIDFAKKAK